jgi:hypothetical protein
MTIRPAGQLFLALLVGLAAVSAAAVSAQGADPMVGTWKLNVAKSKYSPGPAPKAQTVVISGTDQARKLVVDVTPATGTVQHWEVSGASGVDLPVTGTNPNADTYVFKRVNPTTIEAQYKKGGKPTIKQTAAVSADGKTLTVTASGTDATGKAVDNVAVLEK